jgi:hypothetical protein
MEDGIPIRFGMLRQMCKTRRRIITYLESIPGEDWVRVPPGMQVNLATAIAIAFAHDWGCVDAMERKLNPEPFDIRQLPDVQSIINAMKAVEVRIEDLLKTMSDDDLATELNIAHPDDPTRRGTVRDVLEELIDITKPHFLQVGHVMKALGRQEEFFVALGLFDPPPPHVN